MATRVNPGAESVCVEMAFPLAGIDLSMPLERQPARQIGEGQYARTTPAAMNVRGFDTDTGRSRGGARPGLSKYISTPVVADWIIQELALLVGTYNPPGGTVQASNAGRVVTLVAVSQGNVYVANAGDTSWTSTTNATGDTPPLNYTGLMQSTANNQKLYFADGTNWVYYEPATNTVRKWEASGGILPVDGDGNAPRLICTWRGRIVLSGLLKDPQNWFMSRVNFPHDFNYGADPVTPDMAIAGNNAPMGLIGDVVTSICPYTDDVLVFFGDHSIYMMRGDPMAGGQIDLVSDSIGGAWGICWCKDPYGNIYFVSNRTGVYTLVPGQQPQRISQQIEQLLADIDTGESTVRLIWDDRFQGLHVFVSPTGEPGETTHFFYEQRSGAWWTDQFGNTNHDPLTCCVFDGNEPTDRVPLIGSWDGYVRFFDADADDDDGTDIESSVVIGPILTATTDDMLLKEIQAVLGANSGDVRYDIYVGRTAEAALVSTSVETGTLTSGRNTNRMVRRRGHAVYVKLSSTEPWAMETIRAVIAGKGKVARRA